MEKLAVLGSTGSVGKSVLDVVRQNPTQFQIAALSGHSNLALLAEQVREFRPAEVAVPAGKAEDFRALFSEGLSKGLSGDLSEGLSGGRSADLPEGTRLKEGEGALTELSADRKVDRVVLTLAGKSGVKPLFAALAAEKTLVLANKEALVVGGSVALQHFPNLANFIQPIDSEHSAIAQCMQGHQWSDVQKIYLTASGGPFYLKPWEEFDQITQEQALNHPKWKFMGSKVTIDSASLMNKALELIEAHYLFGLAPSKIAALYHPESSVHGIVEFKDGNFLAHISGTDMRFGIAYALSCPSLIGSLANSSPVNGPANDSINRPMNRPINHPRGSLQKEGRPSRLQLDISSGDSHPTPPALSFLEQQKFHFAPIDRQKFPSLNFAYRVLDLQGGAPAFLNGANARLVEAFLRAQIRFSGIFKGLNRAMETLEGCFAEPKKAPAGLIRPHNVDQALANNDYGQEVIDQLLPSL